MTPANATHGGASPCAVSFSPRGAGQAAHCSPRSPGREKAASEGSGPAVTTGQHGWGGGMGQTGRAVAGGKGLQADGLKAVLDPVQSHPVVPWDRRGGSAGSASAGPEV